MEAGPLEGTTLAQNELTLRARVQIVGIRRGERVHHRLLLARPLRAGDRLLLHGTAAALADVGGRPLSFDEADARYGIRDRLLLAELPAGSALLAGHDEDRRLGEAFDLAILGTLADDGLTTARGPVERSARIVLLGPSRGLELMRGLQELTVEPATKDDLIKLESPATAFAEVVLPPRSTVVRRTLRDVEFRRRFGLNVIALQREGKTRHSDLRDVRLGHGDALLVYGPREQLRLLNKEDDFLVLSEAMDEPRRTNRALAAVAITLAVVVTIDLGFVPVHIAMMAGALGMVLSGCVTMDEAYRSIRWQSVFLIAGMVTLGRALDETDAAGLLAKPGLAMLEGGGAYAAILALFVGTTLVTQMLPSTAAVILLAPIALQVADSMNLSADAMVMTVAIAASASFQSPVAHTASMLVMGPGGYRYTDYLKAGLPLTLVVLIATLLLLPVFWPL